MRCPFLAQLPDLLELGRRYQPLQPGNTALPGGQAVRVGGEFGRRLGERGGAGRCAPRAGALGGMLGPFGQRLIRFVGAAGQVPGRLVRVSQRGADGPVQAAPPRPGQHALRSFAQQRMAEPQHRVGRVGVQHPRLQRLIHPPSAAPPSIARSSARVGVSATAAACTTASTSRAEPFQAAAQRVGQRRGQVNRCPVAAAQGGCFAGQFQRRIGAARRQRHYPAQHPG